MSTFEALMFAVAFAALIVSILTFSKEKSKPSLSHSKHWVVYSS